jgi:hypothetical protein
MYTAGFSPCVDMCVENMFASLHGSVSIACCIVQVNIKYRTCLYRTHRQTHSFLLPTPDDRLDSRRLESS